MRPRFRYRGSTVGLPSTTRETGRRRAREPWLWRNRSRCLPLRDTGYAPVMWERAWQVRAGRQGEREQEALRDGIVIVGWEQVPDLDEYRNRAELALDL